MLLPNEAGEEMNDPLYIPHNDRFEVGQVWATSRGFLWKVVSINKVQASLRMGRNGSGRMIRKGIDKIGRWVLVENPSAAPVKDS